MENLFETSIKSLALEKLKRAKMPDNPVAAQKMTDFYLNELGNKRYTTDDKGEVIVIDKEGNPIENRHGWPTSAEDVIDETFNLYFIDNGLPKTEDEAYRLLRNPNITPEERISLTNFINKR